MDETPQDTLRAREIGTPIGDNDSAIAAQAIVSGTVLVTNSVQEFARVRH